MRQTHTLTEWIRKKVKSLMSANGILFLILSALILVSFWFHADGLFTYKTIEPSSRTVIQMENGEAYSETVNGITDSIRSFRLRFGTNMRVNHGLLTVRLMDDDQEAGKWEVDTSTLADNEYYTFDLAHPCTPSRGSIRLDLKEEYEPGTYNNIAVYISNNANIISGGTLALGSFVKQWTLINREQSGKYKRLYFAAALLIVLFAAVCIDFCKTKWYRQILWAVLILYAIQFVDYDLLYSINSKVYFQTWQNSDERIELKASEEHEFSVAVAHSGFSSIEFYTEDKPGKLYVEMMRAGDAEPAFSRLIENYSDEQRVRKYGTIVEPEKGRFEPGRYTMLIRNQGRNPVQISVLDDGSLNAYICQKTFIAHIFLMAVTFIMAIAGIFILNVGIVRLSLPGLFLSMLIPLSIVYLIMFAPWSQPDTPAHYLATYRFSNIMLGVDEDLGRKEDVDFHQNVWGKDSNPSLISYSGIVHHLHLRCLDTKLVEMPRMEKMNYYSIVNYFPEALGLSLGRALNLSCVLCLYISRFFILLAYIAICWYAVAKTPIGKGILALIALLPMCLMMASTISYDPLVIAVSLAFIASVFALKQDKYTTRNIVEAAIWSFLLGALKGGGYVVLLPMALMLLKRERRRVICALTILAAGIVSLLIFDILLPRGGLFQLGEQGSGNMSAIYALQHPLRYLNMSMQSYVLLTDSLIINTGGTRLAWLETTIPDTIVMALYILGGVYSFYERDEIQLRRFDLFVMLSIVAVGAIGVPAMLLSWTRMGVRFVAGLQGRYYLPFVPLFLIAITRHWRSRTNSPNGGDQRVLTSLWGWIYIVSVVGTYYFVRMYLTR